MAKPLSLGATPGISTGLEVPKGTLTVLIIKTGEDPFSFPFLIRG